MRGNRLRTGWTLMAWAAIAALASAGLASGQEEGGGTAAQTQAVNPNKTSYQMKPVTGDVTNTDAQRINADADQDDHSNADPHRGDVEQIRGEAEPADQDQEPHQVSGKRRHS